ncbi:hypothetical protein DTO012A8_9517 [Penicillium roqueforti]|nr:hypothetical protein DTO012A8_9517 [Penicillium roqueforti]
MRQTYQEFEKIAKHHPEAGVDFIPAVEYFDTADATSFLAEENGYTTWPDFQILDPTQYPPQYPSIQLGVSYRSWVLNSPVYLKWLQTRAEAQGTRFIRANLTDLEQVVSVYRENTSQDEIDHVSAVVDASGRGFNDPDSFPSRGQFIIVSNHGDRTISHHWSDGSSTVIIPRPLGGGTVIGGTKEPNNWSEDIDDASTEVILKRVRILCPEMVDEQADGLAATNGFDVKQVYVARRPMRHGGLHFVLKPGNPLPLISCYGAGANGYKISWGLAGKVDEFFSGRPISENDSPTVAKNQALGESEENQAILPGRIGNPVIYEPSVGKALTHGSTSLIVRLKPGVIVKCPRYSWWHSDTADATSFVKDIKHSFEVEERLFDILGTHPSIVRYIGTSEEPRGLLFDEASDGNLQDYIDQHNDDIDLNLRLKWCCQAAEAVYYIHQKGVIHSDLRPDNFLLHSDSKSKLNLLLCDFGGSTNGGDIDGGHLPDPGFFNPSKPWVSTEAVDIFSLGSVFYTIMTGHWPYKSPGPFRSVAENNEYEERVDALFASQQYPSVDGLAGGAVIEGCWGDRYSDMASLIRDQSLSFGAMGASGNGYVSEAQGKGNHELS